MGLVAVNAAFTPCDALDWRLLPAVGDSAELVVVRTFRTSEHERLRSLSWADRLDDSELGYPEAPCAIRQQAGGNEEVS